MHPCGAPSWITALLETCGLSTGATLLPVATLPDLALVIEEPHSFSATEESTGRQVS